MDKPYKDTTSVSERQIIKDFFSGKSLKTLAKEYADMHTSENNRRMTQKEALPIIYEALSKINWGGIIIAFILICFEKKELQNG